MTPALDPYRTLGLTHGASLAEVKRAYRALAKANHPDAAGPSALPRFLAIQAAYEQLVERGGWRAGRGVARGSGTAPGRPSAPDPDRADATHRAYGGRSNRSRGSGRAGPPGSGTTGRGRERSESGATDTSGSTSGGPGPGTTGPSGGNGTRPRGKATLGSTSYDGADGTPFEPDWGGASWYGTTSGTYWTINPKEYADPRKHGPEYQARARRAARGRGGRTPGVDPGDPEASGAPPDVDGADAEPSAGPAPGGAIPDEGRTFGARRRPGATGRRPASGDPASSGAAAREPSAEAASEPAERATGGRDGSPAFADPARETDRPDLGDRDLPPPDLAAAAVDLGRALTDERTAHGRWRWVPAVVGWLPIALGIAWFIDEITGCGRFAATCERSIDMWTPAVAAAVLLALVLVPRLAAVAATAALGLIVAAAPATLFLTATGAAIDDGSRAQSLAVILVGGWLAGLAVAVGRRLRQRRLVRSDSARPVS